MWFQQPWYWIDLIYKLWSSIVSIHRWSIVYIFFFFFFFFRRWRQWRTRRPFSYWTRVCFPCLWMEAASAYQRPMSLTQIRARLPGRCWTWAPWVSRTAPQERTSSLLWKRLCPLMDSSGSAAWHLVWTSEGHVRCQQGCVWQGVQPACHLAGCVCHLLSITTQVGSAQLNYNISNLLQDIWHYLDKSNVRQGSLHKIQGEDGKKILKNAPSRWLDLGRHCPRLLDEWDSLKRFFSQERASLAGPQKSTSEPCDVEASQRKSQKARLLRTEECLNSRECRLDVLFLQYIMAEVMDPIKLINKHFQTADPLVATTRRTLEGFVRKLQSGFVQLSQTRGNLPSAVNDTARSHQKADEELLVGDGVKMYLT